MMYVDHSAGPYVSPHSNGPPLRSSDPSSWSVLTACRVDQQASGSRRRVGFEPSPHALDSQGR